MSKSQDDWIYSLARNDYFDAFNSTLAISAAMFHSLNKVWIVARWTLIAPNMLLDYLHVKYSWETVVSWTRSSNYSFGDAYMNSLPWVEHHLSGSAIEAAHFHALA